MTTEVKVKALKWKADHGVAGIGPYRLFEAFTPLGRFSYGTDSEGSPWWCAQYGGIFTVGDEETAKRQAEAAWSKAALAEVAKFIAIEPSPSMREAVEALEVFARVADTHNEQMPDAMFIDDYEHPEGQPWKSAAGLTIGDLRRARRALRSLTGAKP